MCFSWALIQFKVEEKQYPADQDRDPLGLLSAVMSEHHSQEYQMKSSVKSVMQTCIFFFFTIICCVLVYGEQELFTVITYLWAPFKIHIFYVHGILIIFP